MKPKIWDEGHGSGFEDLVSLDLCLVDYWKNKKRDVKHLFVKDLSRLTRNEIDSYKINSSYSKWVSLYTTDGKYDLTNLENGMMYKSLPCLMNIKSRYHG